VRAIRLSDEFMARVDAWAEKRDDKPGRSEAIRRLVELGLTVKARLKQPGSARAERAKEMAAKQLDQLVDKSAPAEEQESRKRRLLKGPEEFRNVWVDRAKTKDK
jgi:metal-responsive CopG/Arc/MetJ family transcriptional regulator